MLIKDEEDWYNVTAYIEKRGGRKSVRVGVYVKGTRRHLLSHVANRPRKGWISNDRNSEFYLAEPTTKPGCSGSGTICTIGLRIGCLKSLVIQYAT